MSRWIYSCASDSTELRCTLSIKCSSLTDVTRWGPVSLGRLLLIPVAIVDVEESTQNKENLNSCPPFSLSQHVLWSGKVICTTNLLLALICAVCHEVGRKRKVAGFTLIPEAELLYAETHNYNFTIIIQFYAASTNMSPTFFSNKLSLGVSETWMVVTHGHQCIKSSNTAIGNF